MKRTLQLSTSDADEFEATIAPLGGQTRVQPFCAGRFACELRAAKIDKLTVFSVRAPSLKVAAPPQDSFFGFDIPLGGHFLATKGDRPHVFFSDIHLLTPDSPLNLQAESDLRVLAVKLDKGQVEEFALKLNGSREAFELQNDFVISHSRAARAALLPSIAVVWSSFWRKDASAPSEINIAESVDRMLTSFCLATQVEEHSGDKSYERNISRKVATAEEYLRSRLDKSVSRADLAAAAGVSIRTLSRAFSERRGIGPMGFLRRLRTEAAYRDLLGAEPDLISVTAVAHKYGFNHLGKFAVDYKRLFRESPSETLRH
jgi:AraC-like DNA-binding protein